MAGAFILGGVAGLALAGDVMTHSGDPKPNWGNVLLVATGTVATVVGVLLISPLAIRLLASAATRLPVAMRLALRDLGRYQARSGAALAAISLALGIPVAIVVTSAAAQHTADTGNLSDHQLLVRAEDDSGPPLLPEPAEIDGLQAGIDRVATALDDPTVTRLDVPVDPDFGAEAGIDERVPIELAEPTDNGWRGVWSSLYVATPDLLARYGVNLDALDSDTEFLTVETTQLGILGTGPQERDQSDTEMVTNAEILPAGYTSVPGSFITLEGVQRRGWEAAASGQWLIETGEPLTGDQLAAARDMAASAGLTVEARDQQTGLRNLRTGATAIGMLLALGILAMTIGLIRSETAGDLRTLTATGAASGTRRTITATTAAGLAILGVALGTVAAYAVLAAGFGDVADLTPIPIAQLVIIAVGTPLAAAAAGWLLAGREPAVIARQPIA
jgi:putative ABC transport system permease protein